LLNLVQDNENACKVNCSSPLAHQIVQARRHILSRFARKVCM